MSGLNAIRDKIEELQKKLKEQKVFSDQREKELQKYIDECRDTLVSLKEKILLLLSLTFCKR